jgi:Flp pilus assembly CpaF family ATPase
VIEQFSRHVKPTSHSEVAAPVASAMMVKCHGLIAGATGTGKTVTLQAIAEHFSQIGVPVLWPM